MICLKEYKSIIITLFVIALVAAGTVNYVKDLIDQPIESVPEHLQVKAPAEKILHSQKIKDEQGNDIVKYLYASKTEVPAEIIKIGEQEIKEDISKRTKNAQFFKKAVNKDNSQDADTQEGSTASVAAGDNGAAAANESEKEVWVGRFYAGEPFYKDAAENKWYQTETATTTAEEFSKQTKPNFLAKIKSFFNIDALADTGSYYAGAGDGIVNASNAVWNIVHNATSGTANYTATSDICQSRYLSAISYYIDRAFFSIDTSVIDDAGTITAANFYLTVTATDYNPGYNASYSWFTIVQGFQAETNTLTANDFDNCGDAVDNPTEGTDDRKDTYFGFGSGSPSGYYNWALNATGLGWVNKTGFTKFGIRDGSDCLDNPAGGDNSITFVTSDYTGTSQDPYLEVTYTVPSAPAKFRFDGGQMKIQGKVKFE